MNKVLVIMLVFLFLFTSSSHSQLFAQRIKKHKNSNRHNVTFPFFVYVDNNSKQNHFAPSGWMGDYGDIRMNLVSTDKPLRGNSCIKLEYNAAMSQGAGWIGVYWQQPANNWGEKDGGYNLTGAKRLSFWARGSQGGEKISEFKVGGIIGEFSDSDSASIGPIELKKDWTKYTIDLRNKDLKNIIGGFCFVALKDDNPHGFEIYLDDIVYE